MAKTATDVLTEWGARGYYTGTPSTADTAKYTSFINQAKDSILSYCNLPLNIVNFPDGLFYSWVEISYAIMTGGVFEQSTGTVTSVKEGDTQINYSTNKNTATAPIIDYSQTLNRFRRLF
jgi:hypothetical protein